MIPPRFILILAGLAAFGVRPAHGQPPGASPTPEWTLTAPEFKSFDPALPVYRLAATAADCDWFLAREELPELKTRLGDWVPWAVFRTEPGQPLQWQLQKAYRKGKQCYVTVAVAGGGKLDGIATVWFDDQPDGHVHPTVENDEQGGNAYLIFTDAKGGQRRVWIHRSKDVDELSREIKVSEASTWRWKDAPVKPL